MTTLCDQHNLPGYASRRVHKSVLHQQQSSSHIMCCRLCLVGGQIHRKCQEMCTEREREREREHESVRAHRTIALVY
jgi:hypothetical protein